MVATPLVGAVSSELYQIMVCELWTCGMGSWTQGPIYSFVGK